LAREQRSLAASAAHGRRIVETMGDGLLLEFPSAVDATRCAIEVQMAIKTCEQWEPAL